MPDSSSVRRYSFSGQFQLDGAISGSSISKNVKIGNVLQSIARSAIFGSSTALAVLGCIALATSAAFPPTAFIALGVMAAGVALLAVGKKMSAEEGVIKNTASQSLIFAILPPVLPLAIVLLTLHCAFIEYHKPKGSRNL